MAKLLLNIRIIKTNQKLLSNRNKKTIISLCRILIGTIVNNDFTIDVKRKLKEFICTSCGSKSLSYKFWYGNSYRLT